MTAWEYRLLIGMGVPIPVSGFGILGKKISRFAKGWKRSDCYLGSELTLAGVSTAFVSILEILLKPGKVFKGEDVWPLVENGLVAFLGLFLFLAVLSMYQDYVDETNTGTARLKEIKFVGFLANAIGFAVLATAVAVMAD